MVKKLLDVKLHDGTSMQGQVQLRGRVGAITHARGGFLCLQMKRPGTRVQAERMGVQVGDICTAIAGRLNGLGRSANALNDTHHVDTPTTHDM